MTTLHFHCFASKAAFLRSQKIAACEIASQTKGSITFVSAAVAAEFKNNVFVHSLS